MGIVKRAVLIERTLEGRVTVIGFIVSLLVCIGDSVYSWVIGE